MEASSAAIVFIVGMLVMAISEFLNSVNVCVPDYREEFIKVMKEVKNEGKAHEKTKRKIGKRRRIYHLIALVGAILAAVGGYYGFLM